MFYSITLLSIILFVIGLTMNNSLSQSMGAFIGLRNKYFEFSDYLIIITFCTWAWLVVLGLIFVPKNWIAILTCLTLLAPHIIIIIITYANSESFMDILKLYLAVFSFCISDNDDCRNFTIICLCYRKNR